MALRRALYIIDSIIVGCAIGIIWLGFYTWINAGANLGAGLEGRFFPVVEDFTVTDWRRENDGTISVEAFGHKARDCVYIGTSLTYGAEGKLSREAAVVFVDDDTPGSTRPKGTQSFGRWNIKAFDFPGGGFIQGVSIHQCHAGAPTITPFGPFYAPENF